MNFIATLFLCAHSIALAGAAPPPTGETEAIGLEPSRRSEAQASERSAAGAARLKRAAEGAAATYEQVLADPDNVDLNYRYAQTQIRAGDVKGAAATLERILMVDPALHRVRLLYALVLFRLDNLSEAERELDALAALSIPESLRSELMEYKAVIAKKRRATHIDVTAGFGWDYDSNRGAVPNSRQLMFRNGFIDYTPKDPVTRDTAMVGLGSVRVTHDPGTQAGHEVFTGLSWYRQEQTKQDKLDLQAFSFDLGLRMKYPIGEFTPKFTWDHVYLSEEKFLERPSIAMRYDRKVSERLSADFEARFADDMYKKTSDVATAEERSGVQWDLAWGLGYVMNPSMKVHAGYTLTGKQTAMNFLYNAYDRHSFNINHAWLMGKGMFFLTSYTMNIDLYDGPDPLVGRLKLRNDISHRVRITYGTPLGFIHKHFKDFVFTQSYEYFYAESNITNYAYDSDKFSSLVTYKWGW